MEFHKSEGIKECKLLLRRVNCEAIIDTTEQALGDVLFNSETKKKMLLSWLIQQIYSPEICANSTFENLIAMYIPKRILNDFLSGNLHKAEQYKRWKLLLETVYRLQKRGAGHKPNYIVSEIQSGAIIQKYEEVWSKKFEPNIKFTGLVGSKDAKPNVNELKSELEKAKTEIANLDVQKFEFSDITNLLNVNNEPSDIINKIKEGNEEMDELMKIFYALTPVRTVNDASENGRMRYNNLDRNTIRQITVLLRTLSENTEAMNQLVLDGTEK